MESVSYGYCHCGCGEKTSITTKNNTERGAIKGEPRRYLAGHNRRKPSREQVIVNANGCWIWQGAATADGYGIAFYGGKKVYAHRMFYVRYINAIPDGLVLDHLCCEPSCVNPYHLQAVTQETNVRRGSRWKTAPETLAIP